MGSDTLGKSYMKHSFLLSISTIALISSPAYAVDLSEKKALELQKALSTYVTKMSNYSTDEYGYTIEGDVTVTPATGYFKATFPHIKYKTASGGFFDLGRIAINALPTDTAGQWKMAISIPSKMMTYSASNAPIAEISIKKQQFSGIFDEKFGNFLTINATYNDLSIKDLTQSSIVTVPNVSLKQNLKEVETGLISGDFNYAMSNVSVTQAETPVFSANNISMSGTLDKFDMASQQKIEEYSKEIIKDPENPSPIAITNMLSEIYLNSANAITIDVTAKDISFRSPNSDGLMPVDATTLNNANFSFGLHDLKQEKSSISLALGYDLPQSQIKSTSDVMSLIPSKSNITLTLKNVPIKGISDVFITSPGEEASIQPIKTQAMLHLPQMLTQAGTQLEIKNLSATGNGYNAHIEGSVLANTQAMMQLTASIKGTLSGIGSIIAKLNALPETDPQAAKAKKVLGPLTMVQMMGQQDGDSDIRTYDFKLTEQGQMMLNGADLSSMMGGGGTPPR